MIEVRFHGRGGQGAKIASRILGHSGILAGLYAQDFALFGAERRGAPVVSFTRLSTEPIDRRGDIERPDLVVVLDDSLLKEAPGQVYRGVHAHDPADRQCRSAALHYRQPARGRLSRHRHASASPWNISAGTLSAPSPPLIAAKQIAAIDVEQFAVALRHELGDFGLAPELIEKNLARCAPSPRHDTRPRSVAIAVRRKRTVTVLASRPVLGLRAIRRPDDTPSRQRRAAPDRQLAHRAAGHRPGQMQALFSLLSVLPRSGDAPGCREFSPCRLRPLQRVHDLLRGMSHRRHYPKDEE